jgi:hypothetical protein
LGVGSFFAVLPLVLSNGLSNGSARGLAGGRVFGQAVETKREIFQRSGKEGCPGKNLNMPFLLWHEPVFTILECFFILDNRPTGAYLEVSITPPGYAPAPAEI